MATGASPTPEDAATLRGSVGGLTLTTLNSREIESMLMERIEAPEDRTRLIVVRIFRRWAAAHTAEANASAEAIALAGEMGEPAMLAVAIDSLLLLTEACRGRRLHAESFCSPLLSSDERAVLILIATARNTPSLRSDAAIPHGLPAALSWASRCVGRLLGGPVHAPAKDAVKGCPFVPRPEQSGGAERTSEMSPGIKTDAGDSARRGAADRHSHLSPHPSARRHIRQGVEPIAKLRYAPGHRRVPG